MSAHFNVPIGYKVISEEEYLDLNTKASHAESVPALLAKVDELMARVKELEEQLSKTSKNSSKPPSSDGFKRKSVSRGKSNRRSGGQKGHKGTTLQLVAEPDHTQRYEPETCSGCGTFLSGEGEVERRQVFDIPPLKLEVFEHQAVTKVCDCCGKLNKGVFPEGVEQPVQYGHNIGALAVYLHHFQLIPLNRVKQFFGDLFGSSMSEATILKYIENCSQQVKAHESQVKELLIAAGVVHFDESGMYCEGKRKWLHGASTGLVSWFGVHKGRGKEAMDAMGILPFFKGKAIHDRYSTYFMYKDCFHYLCNAHGLRELKFLHQEQGHQWAKMLTELLMEAKAMSEAETPPSQNQILDFLDQYTQIVEPALDAEIALAAQNPVTEKKKGRKKQTKAKNFLDDLKKYKEAFMGFLMDPAVPFDNNQIERDFRMLKVQQKISGCFRTHLGAESFCRVRGYISTAQKNSINLLRAISDALEGRPFIPVRAE